MAEAEIEEIEGKLFEGIEKEVKVEAVDRFKYLGE